LHGSAVSGKRGEMAALIAAAPNGPALENACFGTAAALYNATGWIELRP